jgi:phospholipid/cholesterol/gamma-HCH transport system ATP-binding protein
MIQIKNIHKTFGDKNVLCGISFDIEQGMTTCIIGKSGCGKSVLLKNIVGLMSPDEGEVILDGKKVDSLPSGELFEMRKDIGYVFQGAALFDSGNVYENTIIKLREHGENNEIILENEAKRVLSAVGLLPDIREENTPNFQKEWEILKEKNPADLSGGMKKRVGVARALVGKPKYIFYDEPTTGLDPVGSEQIDFLIARLAKKMDVTSIVISHDMFSVYHIADKVAMIDGGELVFSGTVEEMKNSENKVVFEFIKRFS